MYKVSFCNKKNGHETESSTTTSEVMLPGDFGPKDFTEYLNSIQNNNNNTHYRYYTFGQLWPTEGTLSRYENSSEDTLLVEYEEERKGDVRKASSLFPDWVRCVKVNGQGVYTGGYDGALRKDDHILYEFGSPVQAIDLHNNSSDILLAASESQILCLYANGLKKTTVTKDLTCVRILEVDGDGVVSFCSGHFDGMVRRWRLSRKKGFTCVEEQSLEGCVNEMIPFSKGLLVITSERTYLLSNSITLLYKKGFQCAAILKNQNNNINREESEEEVLVTGSPDGTICTFSLNGFVKQAVIKSEAAIKWISSITLLPDHRIACTSHDGTVRIYSHANPQLLQLIQVIPISPGKKLLTSFFHNGLLYVAGEECIVKSIYI